MPTLRILILKLLSGLLVLFSFASGIPSAASQMDSFYVLPKQKFEKFCEIAHLVPESKKLLIPEGAHLEVRMISEEEKKTEGFKKVQKHYEMVWNYLRANGKQPSRLNWSGYVLYELMEYLKETKNIDLMQKAVCEPQGDFVWWIFDKDTKAKYLDQLDPKKFKESELKKSFLFEAKRKHELAFSKIKERSNELLKEGKLTAEQAKEALHIEELMYRDIDFPQRGKALMDSLKLIHQYLQMVDEDNVVILNIG